MATVDLKKIDADSHFLPQSNFGNVRDLLPGYPQETLDMLLRDAVVFANHLRGVRGQSQIGRIAL